ncbi:MAG: endospore germination permease [Eubacteriaceae bacterium]
MRANITNRQMFFILFLTLTTYSTINLPKIMAESAGRSAWIVILISAIIFGILSTYITRLNNMYQGKVFFDYAQEIIGKKATIIIVIYFLLFIFFTGTYLKFQLLNILTSNFLPLTPKFVPLLLSCLLFGYIAYKGITNIARLFEIYGVLFLIVVVFLSFLMILQGMKENVMPFYNSNDTKHFLTALKSSITLYVGIGILLVIPFNKNNKKAPKTSFLTLLAIGFIYVLIFEGSLMVLGLNNTITFNDAFIEAIKLVRVSVIERSDILYLIFGLMSLFAGISFFNVTILELMCKLFPKIKRLILMFSMDIIFFVLTLLALKMNNVYEIYISLSPYFVIFSSVLILIIFAIAKVKKSSQKNKEKAL